MAVFSKLVLTSRLAINIFITMLVTMNVCFVHKFFGEKMNKKYTEEEEDDDDDDGNGDDAEEEEQARAREEIREKKPHDNGFSPLHYGFLARVKKSQCANIFGACLFRSL